MTQTYIQKKITATNKLSADLVDDASATNKFVTSTEKDTWNGKQPQHTTATATLTVAGWSSKTQTVSVTGVTAGNTVFVSPSGASYLDYSNAQIRCTAQGTDSLTFTCETVPTSSITVNVVMME